MKKIFLLIVLMVIAVSCKTPVTIQTYIAEINRQTYSSDVFSEIKIISDEGYKNTPLAIGITKEKIKDTSKVNILILKKRINYKNYVENCQMAETVKLKKEEAQYLSLKIKEIIKLTTEIDEYTAKVIEYYHSVETIDNEKKVSNKIDFSINFMVYEDTYTTKIGMKRNFLAPFDFEYFNINYYQLKEFDRVLDIALASI